ncbi:Phosphoenolpyruvate carboxykinase [Hibiscus syriacus]|uniref:phosphoenolpyruvate carboxykinase (ATP) n=1 Tax=Hibiscus syriacus TaxID=106335 RepID=A0A6A3AVU3_HIBSY|nr:Phosphoenolpyruvate carboxykinase [Hibiscus syriacus]
MAANRNGVSTAPRSPLVRIKTHKNGIYQDDSGKPVKAQTIDELHSLQKKRSAPTTPLDGAQGIFATISEDERQHQQHQSISASLASLTRGTGPKVVRGDPAGKVQPVRHVAHHHHVEAPTIGVSDSSLKFTHVLYNLSPVATGALATLSGAKTGRSPRDKRVVIDDTPKRRFGGESKGSPNIEMDEHAFMVNRERAVDYLNSLDKVFVNDQFLNWDPNNRIKVRIVSARAYHSLFMHDMCIRPTPEELENFGTPDFTISNAGQFPCNRYTHYITSSTSIDLNLARREMVILGTQYAGEMKNGLFSVVHYLMPKRQILSLHSGCNIDGCCPLLRSLRYSIIRSRSHCGASPRNRYMFSLLCTGKTTLSTDHNRYLIGDDEHRWSDNGMSNIEGGCYAKCIGLSRDKEPDIWNAIKSGTVFENVVMNIQERWITATNQLQVAGTEDGIRSQQQHSRLALAQRSLCCILPSMQPCLPRKCRSMGQRGGLSTLDIQLWVWNAIHSGSLLNATYRKTEVFGLEIPTEIEGVPSEILQPENTKAYKETLLKLAGLFKNNFETFTNYKIGKDNKLTEEILAAGPNF